VTDRSPTPERATGSTPLPPPAIATAFGARLPLAQRYVELLLTAGVERGIIGPREHERVWDRHLANSAALATLLPVGARVVDVGSGAGLPGIPIALLRPDLEIELLEPMQRRVDFLVEALAALGLDRVAVHRGRAPDDLTGDRDTRVIARAVAPLSKLIAATRPVLAAGGAALAIKGQAAQAEMDTVRAEKLPVRLELLTVSFAGLPATVVRIRGLPGSHTPHRSTDAPRRRR
jgi:16S rRNA (guanine527-N7)-methyltransferase